MAKRSSTPKAYCRTPQTATAHRDAGAVLQVQTSRVAAVDSHAAPHRKKVPKHLGQLQTSWSTTLCICRLEELWNALENLSESCGDEVAFAALAALAATGAFAQSTVTISGLLDVAAYSISGNAATATVKAQSLSSRVGSATSAINFNVLEDLGGGLKAQAFVALDPRDFAADGAAIARHETYVGVSGNFGNIRLGAVNTPALTVSGTAGPLGTATGSGFSQDLAAGGSIRSSRGVRYDTPAINGFTASLMVAPGNNDASAATTTAGVAISPLAQQVVDAGVSYVNGPVTIAASSLSRSTSVANNATAAQVKSTYNSIGANFTAGAAKLFAGYGRGTNSSIKPTTAGLSMAFLDNDAGLDTTLSRVGASYTMGAVTLLAQYTTAEIGTVTRKVTGLRADYALSKRSAAYGVYESFDNGAVGTNKINTLAVGVRHSF